MDKEETIRRYGIERYEKMLVRNAKWRETHPEEVIAWMREQGRKGGKYYDKTLKYQRTDLRYKRNLVRHTHGIRWSVFKQIIAPESQLHHEWIPGTADYRGVALVEKNQHMMGYINVIQILEGEITLLTEAEIRGVIERNG